jgi:thymidylate kinase
VTKARREDRLSERRMMSEQSKNGGNRHQMYKRVRQLVSQGSTRTQPDDLIYFTWTEEVVMASKRASAENNLLEKITNHVNYKVLFT